MTHAVDNLWSITQQPHVDADALARAIDEACAGGESLDYRSRLLIRESFAALERCWGLEKLQRWLSQSPHRANIQGAARPETSSEPSDETGFPSLATRTMQPTRPQAIRQFLRELSSHVSKPTRIYIGGSIALMLEGLLTRATEDIDLVDEIPSDLRDQHELLANLSDRYGLRLAHFQSHYLPAGWLQRTKSFRAHGALEVFTVDPYDIFLSKLFSQREKDLDDLRVLSSQIDRVVLESRFADVSSFLADPKLLSAATKNWYILFGQPLPY